MSEQLIIVLNMDSKDKPKKSLEIICSLIFLSIFPYFFFSLPLIGVAFIVQKITVLIVLRRVVACLNKSINSRRENQNNFETKADYAVQDYTTGGFIAIKYWGK